MKIETFYCMGRRYTGEDNQLCLEHIIRPLLSDRAFTCTLPFLRNNPPLVIWEGPNVAVFQYKLKSYLSKQVFRLS